MSRGTSGTKASGLTKAQTEALEGAPRVLTTDSGGGDLTAKERFGLTHGARPHSMEKVRVVATVDSSNAFGVSRQRREATEYGVYVVDGEVLLLSTHGSDSASGRSGSHRDPKGYTSSAPEVLEKASVTARAMQAALDSGEVVEKDRDDFSARWKLRETPPDLAGQRNLRDVNRLDSIRRESRTLRNFAEALESAPNSRMLAALSELGAAIGESEREAGVGGEPGADR